ncbi:Nickel uptake substrate-specific transmembrane region [Planctomycetes bacterium Pla163]|uniref:Nickel uptake substrate-specific transmembrane region n=1 Tax=Rohdeia mirabilis TaxID=2528008 RepID=A0A518D1B5_9BACT|nr:Nickel uptake substrate-specific transmembrane region [Planctomycetes bacterium Pla163]
MRQAALLAVVVLLAAALAFIPFDSGETPRALTPEDATAAARPDKTATDHAAVELAAPGASAGLETELADSEGATASARTSVAAMDTTLDSGPTHPVRVRVVDETGAPVAGAAVHAHHGPRARGDAVAQAATDLDGYAELADVPARFELLAEADGYVLEQSLRGTLESALDADDAVLVVRPAVHVTGVVVDASGAPVEGVRVAIGAPTIFDRMTTSPGVYRAGHGAATAHSNTAGRFELGPVADREHMLTAETPGYVRARVAAQPGTPVRVELDRGAGLEGIVFEADGTPAVGALVRSGSMPTSERVTTDAQGRYVVWGYARPTSGDESGDGFAREAVAIGPRAANSTTSPPYLLVLHEGHAVQVLQPVRPRVDSPAVQDVRLAPAHEIAGRVLTADGTPVAGAEVWIEGTNEVDPGYVTSRRTTWEYMAGIADIETDTDGRFAFDRLYGGLWTVHASFPDDRRTVDVETRAGVDDLVVRLDREALDKVVLAGRVTDGLTGAPIPSFRVVPFVGGMGRFYDVEDSDGRFRVAGLPPGPIRVSISADGFANGSLGERNFALGEHLLDVQLLPTRELVLRVTEDGEHPTDSVQVRVLDSSGAELMLPTGDSGRSSSVWLRGGETGLRGLPAARVTVIATASDGRVARAAIDLAADVLHELTLDLEAKPVEPQEPTTDVLPWVFALAGEESAADFVPTAIGGDQDRDVLGTYFGRHVPDGGATITFEDTEGVTAATVAIEVIAPGNAFTAPTYRIETSFPDGSSSQEGVGAIPNVELAAGRYTVRVDVPGYPAFERIYEVPALDESGWFLPLPLAGE